MKMNQTENQSISNQNKHIKQFCPYCGARLLKGAHFCSACGKSFESSEDETDLSQRKTIYDGEVHKCPNCGEIIDSFVSICPSCGYEIRGARVNNSIKDFANSIVEADDPVKKMNLIRNFPIPNTQEDVLEFMILASTNFMAEFNLANNENKDITDAWLVKSEQCYQKALIIIKDGRRFEKVQHLYNDIQVKIHERKRQEKKKQCMSVFLRSTGLWAGLGVLFIAALIDIFTDTNSSPYHLGGAIMMLIGAITIKRKKDGVIGVMIGIGCGVLALILGTILTDSFDENGSMIQLAGVLALLITVIKLLFSLRDKKGVD